MPLITLSGFFGQNTKKDARILDDGIGVLSLNQRPTEDGALRPWRHPLAIVGPVIPSDRLTMYRLGRTTESTTQFWLSSTLVAHFTRGFDTSDPTERTYWTDGVAPKWIGTDFGLAGTPYPTAARLLAVPQPSTTPTVTLNVDGPSGEARQLYYVFTWVNDIGWESAPSEPFLAPAAKPGAVLDLTASESVPAGNYGVNRIRWYRQQTFAELGSDDSEFFFLREYAIGSVGMQDDGRALTTADGPLPTETWIVLPSTAKWLTQCWNAFAAAIVDKSVGFCVPNFIYAWPLGYRLKFAGQTPLALASFLQQLLVLTDTGAWVVTGNEPGGLDQQEVKLPVVTSQRSVVVGKRFAMWATKDGIHYYGNDATLGVGDRNLLEACITPRQWAAFNPSTIAGYLLEEGEKTYYVGFYNDGALKGFVVDPTNPNGFYPLSTGYSAGYWDPLLRKLFVLDGSTLKQWDSDSTFMTATFRGKVNRQESDTEGEWLELVCEGTAQTKVIVDGVTVLDDALDQGLHRLPDGVCGREWQAEVSTSTGVLGGAVE